MQRRQELTRAAEQIVRQANGSIKEHARDDAEASLMIACIVRALGETILDIAERPYSLKAIAFFETKSS